MVSFVAELTAAGPVDLEFVREPLFIVLLFGESLLFVLAYLYYTK